MSVTRGLKAARNETLLLHFGPMLQWTHRGGTSVALDAPHVSLGSMVSVRVSSRAYTASNLGDAMARVLPPEQVSGHSGVLVQL